jgi:diguanylate cyclase (GGDEF)-like protein
VFAYRIVVTFLVNQKTENPITSWTIMKRTGSLLHPPNRKDSIIESFQQSSTMMLLYFLGVLSAILSLIAFLQMNDWLPLAELHADPLHLNNIWLGSSLSSVILLLSAYAYPKSNGIWPQRLLTLLLAPVAPLTMPTIFYQEFVPHIVWAPFLIALTTTSLRWSLLTVGVTIATIGMIQIPNGAQFSMVSLMTSGGMITILIAFRKVYDKAIHTEQMRRLHSDFLAFHDPLTGLPNRRLLEDRLQQGIKKSTRTSTSLGLVFIDLDHFSDINDRYGHQMGDSCLKMVADHLRESVRQTDTVARFGGDEFVLLVEDISDRHVIDRIVHEFNQQLQVHTLQNRPGFQISASIGVALFPQDAEGPEALIKNADKALYAAKHAGRNQCRYFAEHTQEDAIQSLALSQELEHAVNNKQFEVVYQPIVHLHSGTVRKAEALLRWLHPSRGQIDATEFITAAQNCGMMYEIGNVMFEQAATKTKKWRDTFEPTFQMNVNRSRSEFRSENGEHCMWSEYLKTIGLAVNSMAIEVNEHMLIHGSDHELRHLNKMRNAGWTLALGDFGTGYSSLSHLQNNQMGYVKLDRKFVQNLNTTGTTRVLCKALIEMAHAMDVEVIAEGVETDAQLTLLTQMKCDYVQGYLLGRPMNAQAFESLLEANRSARKSNNSVNMC